MMKRVLQGLAFVTAMATATSAFAATALVTTNLNLRTGPSTGYPAITSMPNGAVVDVRGCTRGYNWCRVDWNGYNGWAAASYLAMRTGPYRHRYYSNYGAEIGVPLIAGAIIGGALLSNHDHYYYDHHHRRYYDHHHNYDRHGHWNSGWHGGDPRHWHGGDHHDWHGGGHYHHGNSGHHWNNAPRRPVCPGGAPPHHGNC